MTDLLTEPKPDPRSAGAGTEDRMPWWKKEFHLGKAIKPDEIMNFSRQASSFLRAGIPILDALAVIAEDNSNKQMQAMLVDVRQRLRAGNGLGDALAAHRDAFPEYYISMVRSAELTGRLDDTLDQLAIYLERDLEARRKIKSALTYPSIVLVMGVLAVVVLAVYVMPQFKDLFGDLGADLPLTTRMLLGTTDFFSNNTALILLGLVALVAAGYAAIGGKHGKERRDKLILWSPGLGPLMEYVIIERFCRVLGAMVSSGVPLPDALKVASDSTNNRVFQAGLTVVRDDMIRGAGLAGPIADSGLFPSSARQMIRVGESTGTLDTQLENSAAYFERELDYRLKRFTDLFEPAIIVAVGVIVGFIALALVQAMYGVFDQVDV